MKYTAEEVRERVARAICAGCEENPDHLGDARGNDYRWQDYLDVADAVIDAHLAGMGEPVAQGESAWLERLKDPATVHALMLRGVIAIPSIRSMVDLRGEVPNGEEVQLLRIAELQEQLAAQPRAVPDGWVLVPREPTPGMIGACVAVWQERIRLKSESGTLLCGGNAEQSFRENWSAMIGAAPQTRAAEGEVKAADFATAMRSCGLSLKTYAEVDREARRIAEERATPSAPKGFPECSGDPASCPENEGFGCCKAHAEAITLHPPAQVAQADPAAKPHTLADFVHAPDAERAQIGQQVAARVDEMMAEPVAQPADSGRAPDGWVLVPREPTKAMLDAAMAREDDEPLTDWGKIIPAPHAEIYKAMLAAAPSAPEGDGGAK